MQTYTFSTHDNVDLVYRHWTAKSGKARGAVVMFHRGHEHALRMAHLVDELNLDDFDFFAWDARGHGDSPGERGFSPDIADSIRDIQTMITTLQHRHGFASENIVVLAQSVGAVLASAWVHDYAPNIRALVLASPAFKIKLYVPFARAGLGLMYKLRGNFYVNSYVKAKYLTHDVARQQSYDSDSKISRPISVNMLLGVYDTAERIVADAQAIHVPTQLLISGADFVVHQAPQQQFFNNLGSKIKEQHILPGFYHDTLGEQNRQLATNKIREFVLRMFAQAPVYEDIRNADKQGYSFDESKQLAQPLSALSPRGLYWSATRLGLKIAGKLSCGVKLGHETGFDSGSSLDYVYRNTAQGCGSLGRFIDRQYINAIGWRGIRQRKLHLEELLRLAMLQLQQQQRDIRVLDIAAGHGRYVLEALTSNSVQPKSILLRDYSDINVRDGNALIQQKGLQHIAQFIHGNAFDRASIAAVNPKPTIGIVSGLYELFPSNDMISTSLAGMADAIESGGYLLYTNQPWHPQLEFIARALTSHRGGDAWVMRRRSQLEMDQLVAAAGFEKITQRIDQWGIFTVSLARKI